MSKQLENVTLIKAHTHMGKPYPVGAKIPVLPHQKAFLVERKIIADAVADDKALAKGKP